MRSLMSGENIARMSLSVKASRQDEVITICESGTDRTACSKVRRQSASKRYKGDCFRLNTPSISRKIITKPNHSSTACKTGNYFKDRYASSGVCVFGILAHFPVLVTVNASDPTPWKSFRSV